MTKNPLFLVGVPALLLAGCAALGPGQPADNAPRAKCLAGQRVCHVDVHVAKCDVTLDPEWKYVASRAGGVTMTWTLRTPGATFAPNGVQLKKATPVLAPKDGGDGKTTIVMHNTTEPGNHMYTVNVVENGKKCDPQDGGVANEK